MDVQRGVEEKMELQLALWEEEIERLEARRTLADADARIGYTLLILVLRQKLEALWEQMLGREPAASPNGTEGDARIAQEADKLAHTLDRAIAVIGP